MPKALIITEKPSVAADIARALGGFKKHKEYYENNRYLLSWAVGHLFELAVPAALKEQDRWELEKLPLLPPEFDLKPGKKMAPRVGVLTKLIKAKDVTEIINACDAGREGELIFRYIIQYAKTKKPLRRLWLSSMTAEAIRDGFARLRSDEEMRPLAAAARCRNEADWLVGINATRAFTLRLSGGKGSTVTSLGRVQTPTLALIVEREKKIQEFQERALFEVFGRFQAEAGSYLGRWLDEDFKKEEPEPDRTKRLLRRLALQLPGALARLEAEHGSLWEEHRAAPRLWHREIAQAIEKKCAGKTGMVELEEKTAQTSISPPLYDLTALQRDANSRFGFSARRTLALAQALYERHKVLTYPRTDSRCLPEDYLPIVRDTLQKLGSTLLGTFAARARERVAPNKRIFNNARVSDHFAIIPTGNLPQGLDRDEAVIFDLVARRFIAVFFPPAEFEITTRITRVEGEPFKTEGKILKVPGWREVYGKASDDPREENLPAVRPGEKVGTERVEIREDKTKPPARYTEATILSAMENVGKLVEDEELAEAMKARGLGTPATRASIIENLIAVRYLHRHGKELRPTSKAMQTIGLLKSIPVAELVSPEMTGEWEYRLREIEQNKLTREAFMRDVRKLARDIVGKAKGFEPDEHVEDAQPFGACPKCREPLVERFKSFSCTSKKCDFSVWKNIAGRLLTRSEFEALLRKKQIGPLNGFRSKAGRLFTAVLKLNSEFKAEFDFTATQEAHMTPIQCEKCGKPMAIKTGRHGEFLACTGYPECKNAMSIKRDGDRIIPVPRAERAPMPEVNISCDKCGAPMAVRMSRRGPFLACTAYPKCRNPKPLPEEVRARMPAAAPKPPPEKTDIPCDQCGKPMVIRSSARGQFLGCSGYPRCKSTRSLPGNLSGEKAPSTPSPETDPSRASEASPPPAADGADEKCDKCGAPMVKRKSRFGEFLGCSAYPKCKHIKKKAEVEM